MRQILHKICVNHVVSVQFRVFITSQIQFGYGSANSASTLSRFHPSLNSSPTLEILLVTDIALKVEQVSSTNAANYYIIFLPTGYIRNLCHWFCNHLCVNLDVNCDIPVDLANSRTCESYKSVLAEAAVRVAKIGVHIIRQTT